MATCSPLYQDRMTCICYLLKYHCLLLIFIKLDFYIFIVYSIILMSTFHEYFWEVLSTYSSTLIKWVLSTYSSIFQAISTQYLLQNWSSVLAPCLHPVWLESSLSAWRSFGSLATYMRTAKTDQSGRMPRLIWGFAGRTGHFVGFVVLRLISEPSLTSEIRYTHL